MTLYNQRRRYLIARTVYVATSRRRGAELTRLADRLTEYASGAVSTTDEGPRRLSPASTGERAEPSPPRPGEP